MCAHRRWIAFKYLNKCLSLREWVIYCYHRHTDGKCCGSSLSAKLNGGTRTAIVRAKWFLFSLIASCTPKWGEKGTEIISTHWTIHRNPNTLTLDVLSNQMAKQRVREDSDYDSGYLPRYYYEKRMRDRQRPKDLIATILRAKPRENVDENKTKNFDYTYTHRRRHHIWKCLYAGWDYVAFHQQTRHKIPTIFNRVQVDFPMNEKQKTSKRRPSTHAKTNRHIGLCFRLKGREYEGERRRQNDLELNNKNSNVRAHGTCR